MSEQKKLRFEDLQPHVDMLCDALENKGASASGIPHPIVMKEFAERYREILNKIRIKQMTFEDLIYELHLLNHEANAAAENNQSHRISKIVHALDIFVMREYNKYRN